jgi:hypothetical protein
LNNGVEAAGVGDGRRFLRKYGPWSTRGSAVVKKRKREKTEMRESLDGKQGKY